MTNWSWFELRFPADLSGEDVAGLLHTLAGEARGGPFFAAPLAVLELEMATTAVVWRLGAAPTTLARLRHAAQAQMPGLSWTSTTPGSFEPTVAIELRVADRNRLLAVDRVEEAAARLLGVVHELRGTEAVLVQWQIGPSLTRSRVPPTGGAQTKHRPQRDSEQVAAARKKVEDHVFGCVGRVAVHAATARRGHQLVAAIGNGIQLLRAPGVGISRRGLPSWWVAHRLGIYRVSRVDPPCRLTAAELAGVIGWPLGGPRLPGIAYVSAKVLPLSEANLVAETRARLGHRVIGESRYPGQTGQVAVLPAQEALRHLHVLGPSGVGKSTLLAQLLLADISAGRAVVLVDPKGDLVTDVLARVPEAHLERVVVLDPGDESPVGFNPLTGGAVGIDAVVHVLRSVWADSWGPRLGDVLLAGLTTLSATPGHSLAELPLLLRDPVFRRPLVARAVGQDPLGLGG